MSTYPAGGAILRGDLRGVVEEAFRTSETYIGAQVMPPLPVMAKGGQYPTLKVNKGNLLRDEAKRRGPAANYARISRSYENDTYTAIEYGIEAVVDDSESNNLSRFFDLEATETRRAYGQIQLAHERRVKSKIFDPAVFSLTTSGTAYTEANLATFNVGLDIDAVKAAIQGRGEDVSQLTAVMSLAVFNRIRASTPLQNRIRGTISTDSFLVLDRQAVADALGIKNVLVGLAVYDTSKQGAASSTLSPVWTDTYIWVGNVQTPTGPDQYFNGSVGFTLFWQEDADIFQVESYREEDIRSTIIRARQFTDEKIVLSTAGQLLVTQFS